MSIHVMPAVERLAYGREVDPLLLDYDEIHVAARPMTALVGRIMLGAIFLLSGIAKVSDPSGAIDYMNAAGIPAAGLLVWIAGGAEIAGGLSLVTGLLTRVGALGLIVFLALATWYFHAFWNLAGAERLTQQVNFMKNFAIAGGLSFVVANGAGRYSLDHLLRKTRLP